MSDDAEVPFVPFVPIHLAESTPADDSSTLPTIMGVCVALLACWLALLWCVRHAIAAAVLRGIDALVGGILEGPRMRSAVASLVDELLAKPSSRRAISGVVCGVISDDESREAIASVVGAVLEEEELRGHITVRFPVYRRRSFSIRAARVLTPTAAPSAHRPSMHKCALRHTQVRPPTPPARRPHARAAGRRP